MPHEPAAGSPRISVVMPVRNEGQYVEASLDALDLQAYPRDRIEIVVVDGGSDDGTVDAVERRARTDPRIRLLGGPGVNTPAAMNIGIAASTGAYVAKVDGHGWVDPGFLAAAAAVLDAYPDVGCVGGEIVPVVSTPTQRAIELARFSKLGVGSGIYTAPRVVHDIDTVQCGVYRRGVLEAVGSFDPELQFGEDEEVNHRVRASGARIVYEPAMRFHYHVRPTIGALFRQYYNYGLARVRVVRKHPDFLRVKHLIPAVLVLVLVGAALAAVLVDMRIGIFGIGGYLAGIGIGGVALSSRHRFERPDLVALALASLHLGYGLGTLAGLGALVRPRR